MRRCLAHAAIAATALALVHGQDAAYFKPSVDAVVLNDPATYAEGLKTLFTEDTFEVQAALTWESTEPSASTTYMLKVETFVDDVLVYSGEEDLSGTENGTVTLPSSVPAGSASVATAGSHTVRVSVTLGADSSEGESTHQAIAQGVSIIPLLIILFMAALTQMVELSLGFGVFVGACIVTGTVSDGFKATLDTYILGALADEGHGFVYLFTLFLAGTVGMMEKSGGILGLTKILSKIAKDARLGQLAAFLAGLLIFFDDYANCLVVGATMKPVLDGLFVSREKLAFIVDATAAPIASLVPISSWVGYEVGLIQDELDKIQKLADDGEGPSTDGIKDTGLGVFIATIPYRYYPFFMLFLQILLIVSKRDMGPMLIAERLTMVYKRTDGGRGVFKSGKNLSSGNEPSPDTPLYAWNMLVPVLFLVFFIFYILVQSGKSDDEDQSFLDIIQNSDSYVALLWGTMAAALVSMVFYMIQFKKDGKLAVPTPHSICGLRQAKKDMPQYAVPLMTPREGMDSFLHGLGRVFPALVVLTLAWASGAIMGDVGTNRLFSKWIVNSGLSASSLPTITFLLSFLMALATGTSWGTMAIVFPLVTVPSWIASDGSSKILYAVIGSVLAGAVAGDHVSPISDTTVLSSLATDCDLLAHVKTQAPYVFLVALWAILVGTIPVGNDSYSTGVAILMGFIMCAISVVLFCSQILHRTGRFDIFTELYILISKDEFLGKLKGDTALAASGSDQPRVELHEANNAAEADEEHLPDAKIDQEGQQVTQV